RRDWFASLADSSLGYLQPELRAPDRLTGNLVNDLLRALRGYLDEAEALQHANVPDVLALEVRVVHDRADHVGGLEALGAATRHDQLHHRAVDRTARLGVTRAAGLGLLLDLVHLDRDARAHLLRRRVGGPLRDRRLGVLLDRLELV